MGEPRHENDQRHDCGHRRHQRELPAGQRTGRTPDAFPAVPPEQLAGLLAMTERDLAAELHITRWKATQFKKQYAAGGANGSARLCRLPSPVPRPARTA